MKKITSFIVALVFTAAIAMAIINTAAQEIKLNGKHSYATIISSPPPPPKEDGDEPLGGASGGAG